MLGNLLSSGSLLRRFVANGTRQGLAAAFFFTTTLLLSHSLTPKGYAHYFASWNVAGVVVALISFGIYNEIIRRLILGQSLRQLFQALQLPFCMQLSALGLISWLIDRFSDYDGLLIFCIAGSSALGAVATAVALGRDRFRIFLQGELAQSLAFLLLVALFLPNDTRSVGYFYVAALIVKIAVYVAGRKQLAKPRAPGDPQRAQPNTPTHLMGAYTNALLQSATLRAFFIVTGWVVTPSQLESIAVAWAFCDRSIMVVQGVGQIFYPKLMSGEISNRARVYIQMLTVGAFTAVSLGMICLWAAFSAWRGVDIGGVAWLSVAICAAFIPYVLRLLKMTEALAEYRFRSLLSSHAIAGSSFVLLTVVAIDAQVQTLWFPVALIALVSLAGLPPLYRTANS